MSTVDLAALARTWIEGDPDPVTRDALQALLDAGDQQVLADHLGGSLTFGTAGIRGIVGPGPLRMNRAVVIRTSRGLAEHILAEVDPQRRRPVIVGFDGRTDSRRFAEDTVGVLAAAGLPVRWFPQPVPTPLVAYAAKTLQASAAVVVTASHNPPDYNGYKVYGPDAVQIVEPRDRQIAAAIDAVSPASQVPRLEPPFTGEGDVAPVDAEVVDRYLADLAAARPRIDGPPLTVVYTPLHGVAGTLMQRAFAEAGYDDVHVVASQAEPDGTFPTVPFPNPEEPGALDEALALAREVDADLILANDPDGDRLAVAIPDGMGAWRALTGNQIGVLLADHLLRHSDVDRPLVISSIVSSPMLGEVAAGHDARFEQTLTGFKWICTAALALEQEDARSFVLGYEEALGYSVGPVVRDKDGIGAAVVFADLVRHLAASGRTIPDRLEDLYTHYGLWISRQHSVERPGLEGQAEIAEAMELLTRRQPEQLGPRKVLAVTDFREGADNRPLWLPQTDMVAFDLDGGGRVMIRPSGTEPKCKIYVDLRADVGADPTGRERELHVEAGYVATDLAAFVGLE